MNQQTALLINAAKNICFKLKIADYTENLVIQSLAFSLIHW